jgi:aminoglycoside phosphotransferase (APT) family kinase protein
VIAVLDWELSTLGHPLMDVVYVLSPYWFHPEQAYRKDGQTASGMPSEDELLDRYTSIVGFDPRNEKWKVAQVFHLIRVSWAQALHDVKLTKVGRNDQPWNTSQIDNWASQQRVLL